MGEVFALKYLEMGHFRAQSKKVKKGRVFWNGLNNNPKSSDDFWQKYTQAPEIDGPFLTWLVLGILGYVYISKEPTATYQIQYITKYKQRNINILSKFKKLNSFYFSETRCLYVYLQWHVSLENQKILLSCLSVLTDNETARALKFMSSSRRMISEDSPYEDFRNSMTEVVEGEFPDFFDFSDCKWQKGKDIVRIRLQLLHPIISMSALSTLS